MMTLASSTFAFGPLQSSATLSTVIIGSALPIAIVVNAFRVALTGFLTHYYGKEAAEGAIHMTEGFITFSLALALLLLEAWLLKLFWPDSWRRRKTA